MNRKNPQRMLAMLLSAALLLPIAGCAAVSEQPAEPEQGGAAVRTLAAPTYPETVPFPNERDYNGSLEAYWAAYDRWQEAAQRELPDLPDGTEAFWQRSIAQFLSDAGTENRVYSPLNVYLALAMLAETTAGESRAQLLDLLGADSIEALRRQAAALWQACYADDGVTKTLLGSSMWLKDGVSYNAQTLQTLAEAYYASAFSGQMGSDAYNRQLQDWINEQTGNLLTEQAGQIEMTPQTVLALVTTLYFKAPWAKRFAAEDTENGIFHAQSGDLTCAFLHESAEYVYYEGENFGAIGKTLQGAGTMYFLLPKQGVTAEQLLQDPQALAFLAGDRSVAHGDKALVHFALPKFDVSSQLSLNEGLKALGVSDVFEAGTADFSPLTDAAADLYVSKTEHSARVLVDEDGCEAAAFTAIMVESRGAMRINREIDFTLDRPFLFGLVTDAGVPLFTGIVNQP